MTSKLIKKTEKKQKISTTVHLQSGKHEKIMKNIKDKNQKIHILYVWEAGKDGGCKSWLMNNKRRYNNMSHLVFVSCSFKILLLCIYFKVFWSSWWSAHGKLNNEQKERGFIFLLHYCNVGSLPCNMKYLEATVVVIWSSISKTELN